jgi:hypothetical protein
MADFEVETHVDGAPEAVKRLLSDPLFLKAFVDKQQAAAGPAADITVDDDHSSATWEVTLPGDVPDIAKRLVGRTLKLHMDIKTGNEGRVDVDAKGKFAGRMRGTLGLVPVDVGTDVKIAGSVHVSAGPLSSLAAKLARDLVLKPVLEDDLFGLLRDWSAVTR